MGTQGNAAPLKGSVRLGSYLKRLRTGYGYSLRRVEERARAGGGEIDNSQLSRYEKGICYPSFDKLRVLASVFNVPIQAFSDVVDLEGFEHLVPEVNDPSELLDYGQARMIAGDTGQAFACYEHALEMLEALPAAARSRELEARLRVSQAIALHRLGKLSLAEQELRNALRDLERLSGRLRAQAVLNLANVHADQGDLFLAEMEAERAYRFALDEDIELLAARSLHTLGRVLAERHQHSEAIDRYRQAVNLYQHCEEPHEAIRVRVNIGGCYVALGKTREGVRLLKSVLLESRQHGHRRQQARAWSYLGEAYYSLGDRPRARQCLAESDGLSAAGEKYIDLMFINSFYDWKMARDENNPTREKIAFGRLKVLRSGQERKFPEVEAFDDYVEGGRHHA